MPESFGARLRQRRERQQIALSTIAEQTKIKISLLEGLEHDDVSHWPSGIFRRAFIRAYAHAIGLEPDIVVREFLDLYPDPAEIVATLPGGMPAGQLADNSAGPPTRLRNLFGSALGSLSRLGARSATKPSEAVQHPLTIYPPFEGELPDLTVEFAHDLGIPETAPDREAQTVGVTSEPGPPVLIEEAPSEPAPPLAIPDREAAAMVPARTFESPLDLLPFAELCTSLGRVDSGSDIAPLLAEAERLLDAVGLIVWIWDARAVELRPALAHGYSDNVLAQLPRVDRDTNNATAAAFRAGQTCVVSSTEDASGALVVPLMTPGGCAGVLAIELQHGREESELVRALAMIFAAQLATLIGSAQPAEASDRRFA
jgi:transcriptional regulator with XRE-family HTH domain